MTAKSILKEALNLPRGQRLKLAEDLLDSTFDQDALIAGGKVAEGRWRAYRQGVTGAKPAREAIEALIQRKRTKT
jgi:hypothetical protein